MWFSSDQGSSVNLAEVSVDRIKEIIALNKKGIKPNKLIESREVEEKRTQPLGFTDGLEEDSLTRFDAKAQQNRKKKKKSRYKGNQNQRNE